MLLTDQEIVARNIVQGAPQQGHRHTTYDATVGEIISCGARIDDVSFRLKSRGVAWVVSNEDFHIPQDTTGVATLRTSWAHDGVFALNVGVLDPGWKGPVATALVNFGRDDFIVRKGDPFLRVLFFTGQTTSAASIVKDREAYIREMTGKSRGFSETFLNMSSLVHDVAKEVLRLPKWAYVLTIAAIFISIISIFAPIAYTVWSDHLKNQVAVTLLEQKLQTLEDRLKEQDATDKASAVSAAASTKSSKSPASKTTAKSVKE